MALYRIRKADGQEFAPVTADVVRQWLANGLIFGRTLVQEEGAIDWKELRSVAEITSLPAPLPGAQAMAPIPALPEGSTSAGLNAALAGTTRTLGIASLLTCPFLIGMLLAIPTIICGHIACRRSRRFPDRYGGLTKAKGGLIMGYLALIGPLVMMMVFFPQARNARLAASAPYCLKNLSLISQANLVWASNHHGLLAPSFLSLSNELRNPLTLVCPSLREYPNWTEATDWRRIDTTWFTYDYLTPGFSLATASNEVALLCRRHGHVAYGNGRVITSAK